MSHETNDRNEVRPQHDQSSSGAAVGSAAHVPRVASEDLSHQVFVQFPPGDHAGNERSFELYCDNCDYIGAIQDRELAPKVASLHTDFFGPLRDLAKEM